MLQWIVNYFKAHKFTEETAKRAARTFVQTFVPTVCTDLGIALANGEGKKYILCSVVIPAAATAIAAVMNMEKVESED